MSRIDVVRAWKDEEYRLTLSTEELSALPPNPAGVIELSDEDLGNVAGGTNFSFTCTLGEICMSYIVSCVWTCGCTPGCLPKPILPAQDSAS